jgi:hypothetical protein
LLAIPAAFVLDRPYHDELAGTDVIVD